MKKIMRFKKNIIYFYISIALLLVSCTDVELCNENNHPHTAQFSFDLTWNQFATEKPDSMYFFLSRLINTKHYIFSSPIDTLDSNSTKGENEDPSKTHEIEGGEYVLITCSQNEEAFDIANKEAFAADPSMQINNLILEIKETADPDIDSLKKGEWKDLNPYYKKLKRTGKIFRNVERIQFYANSFYTLSLNPEPITQHIKFRFKLKVDPQITINRVIGEISGVPKSIKLTTGILDKSELCRSYFPVKEIETVEDTITIYEGEVDVLGLFPNTSTAAIYGAGILQLGIYTQKGKTFNVFNKRINLIKTITDAQLTVLTEDGKNYISNPNIKETVLEINSLLTISQEGAEQDPSSPPGVDNWVTDKDGNIDIET